MWSLQDILGKMQRDILLHKQHNVTMNIAG